MKTERELQKKYDAIHNAFIVTDDCRKEWHVSYMSALKERDELRARVDKALNMLCKLQYSSGERIYGEVGSILKGNKDD